MSSIDAIREQITKLFQENPKIHLNVALKNPKLNLTNTEATIVGVFPRIFQIEENRSGKPKRHVLQYSDIIVKQIVVLELEKKEKDK